MRTISLVLLSVALGGCSLSLPSSSSGPAVTAQQPADRFVGKQLDTLVAQFGPPKRSAILENDQTSLVWQFETPLGDPRATGDAGLYGDGNAPAYVSEGYSPFCRLTVTVTTSTGIVTQANTEQSNGTGASVMRREDICSQYLRTKRQS